MSGKVKINRLKVSHYGPLSDFDMEFDEGLNAFYGKNESGKTLLVESITKMLIDDSSRFKGIGRVSQRPNGLLTVENSEGEFDASQESLEKVFGNVTSEDVRNAFVIRDFDLRLPERENDFGNGDYFKDVTDRVLGSKTQKIEALRSEIADVGKLTNSTSNARLKNTKNTDHLKDKRDRAKRLKSEIQQFLDKVEEKGLFKKYSRVDAIEKEISSMEKRLNELENAKKQDKYIKGQELLDQLRKAREDMKDLEREKRAFKDLETIRKRAQNFEMEASEKSDLKTASVGSGILSGLSLVVAALNPGLLTLGISVIFLAVAIFTGYRFIDASRELSSQKQDRKDIIKEAGAKDIRADTLPEVVDAINSYEQDIEDREKEINERRSQAVGELKGLFNASVEEPERWTRELDNFSNSFESVEIEFEEGDLEEAEKNLEELKEKKKELRGEVDQYDETLKEFDSGISQALDSRFIDGKPASVSSVEDLDFASRQLEEFVSSLDEMVQASKNAIEVLEEMEEQEEDEFNRIFNEDSYAVEMFAKATDGNYTDIKYEKESRKLKVVRSDGKELDPEALSQGTYDLLYMSIRLKLAREILGEPGFLVMDNAFVHSDIDRIEREIEFLTELEDEGWQIIYFTFRDDVRELLDEKTDVRELEGLDF